VAASAAEAVVPATAEEAVVGVASVEEAEALVEEEEALAEAAASVVAGAADIAKKQHLWQAVPLRIKFFLSGRVKIIRPFRRFPWPVYDQRRLGHRRQLKSQQAEHSSAAPFPHAFFVFFTPLRSSFVVRKSF
jgi:hypothetical protein